MACNPEDLKKVPLLSLLDDEAIAVLTGQVEVRTFVPPELDVRSPFSGWFLTQILAYEKGAECLIVGTGQHGMVRLSEETADFFAARSLQVSLEPTPKAIASWNRAAGAEIGPFDVTC